MAFCKYSFDMLANNTTAVDNIFINNYLPYADSTAVKVYLYGLYKCQDSNSKDNTLEHFAQELHLKEDEIEKAFLYWQEQGLIQILNVIPFEVRYLPISDVLNNTKKYNAKKYQNFNTQAQEIISGRMITPNEYREYYDLVERLHIEKDALLEVINYCVRTKGDNIGYNYITVVAKNWINQGLTTAQQIKEKILEIETLNSGMKNLVKALGIKRAFTMEEYELFKKWAVEFGFEIEVISYVAKKNKAKSNFIFQAVDKALEKYYAQKLSTIEEIEAFEEQKSSSYTLAKNITKNLGLYYEHLDPVLENYVLPWTNLGFGEGMLISLSNYCFKTNVRTLEGMHKVLSKFQKMGILSEQSLAEYMQDVLAVDKKIKTVLENIGLSRNVNQFDRDKFRVWTENWHLPQDVIDYACTLAIGKDQPMQYLSGILSSFHDKNITTLEDAKNSFDIVSTKSQNKTNFSTGRSYSKEEMNALFQSIEEIEI
ncbi:MAG: DnaD domain protein [Clostridia bacterium]|nr:DnaD domain protein [Clostridia bacterium]